MSPHGFTAQRTALDLEEGAPAIEALLKHVTAQEIPATQELFEREELEAFVLEQGDLSYSLIAVGDIMLSERAEEPIERYGSDYPFHAVLPLLRTAPCLFGNLEGP